MANTETTRTAPIAWRPDVQAVTAQDAVPESLIMNTSTVAGHVEGDAVSLRVPYVDDAAAAFVAEGEKIDEAQPDLAECVVYTSKVAQLLRISREQYGQANAAALLSGSVGRAITRAANTSYVQGPHSATREQVLTITGAPTGGTFTLSAGTATTATIAHDAAAGTVQTAVRTLGGGYATATVAGSAGGPWTVTATKPIDALKATTTGLTGGSKPSVTVTAIPSPIAGLYNVPGIVPGGAVAADLDALIDLQATIEGNDGLPSHILLSPSAWASLRKFKDETDSARSLIGAGTTDATRTLLNIPVTVTNALADGTGLMLDRTAIVSAVGDVQVAISDQHFFDSDSIAVRATWRFGQNVVRPNRIGKFTVTAPA